MITVQKSLQFSEEPTSHYHISHDISWLDPNEHYTEDFLVTWRRKVKERLDYIFAMLRPRLCLVCSEPFDVFDMHEGIASRRDVQGWKKPKRSLIMTELNCIPLHHTCHLDRPPTREKVWEYQKEFYGETTLNLWYFGLPWKIGRPPRYF